MGEKITVRPNGTKRVQYFTEGPSLTRQEFKDECDLGKILQRFGRTPEGMQLLENARGYVSERFDDVSGVLHYREALDAVKRAETVFDSLPVELRVRFDHSPEKFLNFVDDPKNLDELRTLGLAKPKVEAVALKHEVSKDAHHK